MSLTTNLIFNLYAITILIVLLVQQHRQHDRKAAQYRLFIAMSSVAMFLLLMDILSRMDGLTPGWFAVANKIGNFAVFMTNPVLPSIWLIFVYDQINSNPLKLRRVIRRLSLLHIGYMTIFLIGNSRGLFYTIDAENIYHRGPMYLLLVVWTMTLILVSELIIIFYHNNIERKHRFAMLFFPIPPIIGIILQVAVYGVSLMLTTTVISILVMFLNMQNRHMSIDYLTGVNNRKKLDEVLQDRFRVCQDGSCSFGAIMIDLNDFKRINDTLGHDIGDDALETTARLLRSCVRADDTIARFGGDEFVIVMNASDRQRLRATASRIMARLKHFNRHSTKPYELSFSLGYALFDRSQHRTPEDLLRHLDLLMYEHKRQIKAERRVAEQIKRNII